MTYLTKDDLIVDQYYNGLYKGDGSYCIIQYNGVLNGDFGKYLYGSSSRSGFQKVKSSGDLTYIENWLNATSEDIEHFQQCEKASKFVKYTPEKNFQPKQYSYDIF